MTKLWWTTVIVGVAAGLGATGCKKRYECFEHGDTSALAAWQARGLATDGAQICEASARRFSAVYTAPRVWVDEWTRVEKDLVQRGWADSRRKGYQQELDAIGASSVLEKCTPFDRQGKLIECSDEVRLHVEKLPTEWKDFPFAVRADYSATAFHYFFGERKDGPIPAFARAHKEAR